MALRLTKANSEYCSITSGLGSFPCNAPFTIAGWIFPIATPGADDHYFLNWSADGTFANADILQLSSSGKFRLITSDEDHHAGQLQDISGSTDIAFNTDWYFIALVFDGAGLSLYLNTGAGATLELASTLDLSDRAPITSIVLGNYVGGGSHYSDMRFWGWKAWADALNTSELDDEFTQGLPLRTANLWACWDFEPTARNEDDFSTHDWTEFNTPTDEAAPSVPLGTIGGASGAACSRIGAALVNRGAIIGSLVR